MNEERKVLGILAIIFGAILYLGLGCLLLTIYLLLLLS